MHPNPAAEITNMATLAAAGDRRAASRLLRIVYPSLRRMAADFMRDERPDHPLQPTELVHEAFLRLFAGSNIRFTDRNHFFSMVARKMRHVLTEHGRKRLAAVRRMECRRGAGEEPASADDYQTFLILAELIEKLETVDPRAAKVVELRFFCGFSEEEIAEEIGCSIRTVERDWAFARGWLCQALQEQR